jgi:hypothetical protein
VPFTSTRKELKERGMDMNEKRGSGNSTGDEKGC